MTQHKIICDLAHTGLHALKTPLGAGQCEVLALLFKVLLTFPDKKSR